MVCCLLLQSSGFCLSYRVLSSLRSYARSFFEVDCVERVLNWEIGRLGDLETWRLNELEGESIRIPAVFLSI